MNIAYRINEARAGRSQTWIVQRMNEMGLNITESKFSRKKHGIDEFTDKELKALKKIIGLNYENKGHTVK